MKNARPLIAATSAGLLLTAVAAILLASPSFAASSPYCPPAQATDVICAVSATY
jgi:hypothetical protein